MQPCVQRCKASSYLHMQQTHTMSCSQIALLENRAQARPQVGRIPALDPRERAELGITADPYDLAERGDPQNLVSERSLAKFLYRAHDPLKLHKEQERPGVWNPLYRWVQGRLANFE